MFALAPNAALTQASITLLNKYSTFTTFAEDGKGPWDHIKDSQEQYDYIVCGGGSAGCVVANRLAEDPKVNVLVLEAGYSDDIISSMTPVTLMYHVDTDRDWCLKTTPQIHADGRVMKQPRGKMLGGSSSINAMIYHRGASCDYDEWESLGNPGWSYKECLPYFKKSEGFNDPDLPPSHPRGPLTKRIRKAKYETYEPEYHGTEGPWQVTFHYLHGSSERFIEVNMMEGVPRNKDFNGRTTLGVNRIQTFIQRDGTRSSLARAFLKGKQIVPGGGARGRIRVVYGANISRILTQARRGVKMAYGVEFLDHKNVQRRVLAAREVLLCAGAFGSPHLLLASGIGPIRQPSIPHVHTLPGVGINLEDHLCVEVVFRARSRAHVTHGDMNFPRVLLSVLNYKLYGTGVMTCQVGEAANFVRLEDIAPDFVEREKANGTYKERASGPNSPHIEVIFIPGYFKGHGKEVATDTKNYYTLVAVLLHPCSSGTVTIRPKEQTSGSSTAEWETVIDPNYCSDPFDVRVLAEAIKFMRKLGRRLNEDPEVGGREIYPGEEAVPDHDDAKLQQYVRQTSNTIYHPTSTCRMGPTSDPLAVVDSRLNVHGIEKLRVIDASVIPKIPGAHTCAPVVMIAERASDFIKEDWQDLEAHQKEQ
ncbi:hypothetical protein BX616_003296 [Lobosporangium transversale]|uniref:Glucose-methanol-choline oxidoreductase N-terminal domain-containing protein n=1 Tax=Lobosporangium transversale TaxID=64571 RepID=A0A1Y2GL64_9FUNG|nr:hypothetical protein BCR41DRAFT_323975 [Lobosporangium transversale]KAF9916619.1 hypothetical protein BX616_003296 [Lobosporangium transversale]ORZ12893.1 hypothetical protein BCR41DRAFT_323975 [Lobosporangium transversale]|eukprot:XP_021880242.1 hypothetical protein BCR41DRAFT_323975 [Lobosporangium transversale]